MLIQNLPPDERRQYRQGDFGLYCKVEPDDPEQEELKKKYESSGTFGYVGRGICQHCGIVFYWVDKGKHGIVRKYCSGRCANDAYILRRKARHKAALQRICPVCGKTFVAKRTDSVYCEGACRQKAYRQRSKTVTDSRLQDI